MHVFAKESEVEHAFGNVTCVCCKMRGKKGLLLVQKSSFNMRFTLAVFCVVFFYVYVCKSLLLWPVCGRRNRIIFLTTLSLETQLMIFFIYTRQTLWGTVQYVYNVKLGSLTFSGFSLRSD